uniref:Elongation factor P n=1 Tax=Prymnesium polylepis TaxID=72548 RepID=A0A7S4HF37_9EUKA|mmetsp:Transcript_14900/g.37917  ORF Transcript_14900/g.37917 Transcript_14900/m.37917 type:complete len:188 (+) Transcript_14900:3-566(+)
MGNTNDFKIGLTIEFEDNVWKVVEFLHVKPGKGSAFVRSKLKNLQTGSVLEKTWKAGESFPDAQVDKEEMTFSYIDGEEHVFMNMESFEEERIKTDDIDKSDFIKEEMSLNVLKWRGKAIDVQVPKTVTLKVVEAAPGAKGNTAQGRAEKPAVLETGATVNVPIFIEEGEMVRIDTDDRKYLGRDNS